MMWGVKVRWLRRSRHGVVGSGIGGKDRGRGVGSRIVEGMHRLVGFGRDGEVGRAGKVVGLRGRGGEVQVDCN